MDTEVFFAELLALNEYEQQGHAYFEARGRVPIYSALLLLPEHVELIAGLDHILAKIDAQTEKANSDARVASTEDYISSPKTIEMEQLLRYVMIPPHQHEFYELVFVLSGTCEHRIGDQTFSHHTGDFTIIPPGISHFLDASPDCVCLTAKATVQTFRSLFYKILHQNSKFSAYLNQSISHPYFRCAMTLSVGEDPFVRSSLLQAYYQQTNGQSYGTVITESLLQAVIAYILQSYEDTAVFLTTDSARQQQALEILSYLFENYQTVTLHEAAEHFHYNPSYLSAKLQHLTGQNFSSLIKNYKLRQAEHLLRTTDLPLGDVCEQVGYLDTAQFIRSFKERYGQSPIKYRKALK